MPVYVFRCVDCHQEFQVKTAWRDKAAVRCAQCGGSNLQELFGRYTFQVAAGKSTEPQECSPTACHSCSHATAGCPISH